MKKLVSICLAAIFLFLCIPVNAYAVIPGEDSIAGSIASTYTDVDELLSIRAKLLMDPNASEEQFNQIDAQLRNLGVEELSTEEVIAKFGDNAQPMIDVPSTSHTTWYSTRKIVVVWGRQYEAQTIYGQWTNGQSPLTKIYDGTRQYNGAELATVNAIQVVAEDIVTASIGSFAPQVGASLTAMKTLYDIWREIDTSLSPFSVVEDAAYSFKIQMGTTVKLVYVKNAGSPDEGYQVLTYVGTEVNYNVDIYIPVFTTENGYQEMYIEIKRYSDYAKSYSYDSPDCEYFAANNLRLIHSGATYIDYEHRIMVIPIIIMDEVYRAKVPFSYF